MRALDRKLYRQKLYAARTPLYGGRGGVAIPESSADARRPGLVQMWPLYLDAELAAAKPTLSLPDVAAMLEQRATPQFHGFAPRPLSENEVRVIRAWYDAAKARESEQLGAALAQLQSNVMSQAAAHHGEAMGTAAAQHDEVMGTLATIVSAVAPQDKKAKKDARKQAKKDAKKAKKEAKRQAKKDAKKRRREQRDSELVEEELCEVCGKHRRAQGTLCQNCTPSVSGAVGSCAGSAAAEPQPARAVAADLAAPGAKAAAVASAAQRPAKRPRAHPADPKRECKSTPAVSAPVPKELKAPPAGMAAEPGAHLGAKASVAVPAPNASALVTVSSGAAQLGAPAAGAQAVPPATKRSQRSARAAAPPGAATGAALASPTQAATEPSADEGRAGKKRRPAPDTAPPKKAEPADGTRVQSQRSDEMLAILQQLTFAKRKNDAKRFAHHYTIGDTCQLPGCKGFDLNGVNREIVSDHQLKGLRPEMRESERALLLQLWELLKEEGKHLGYEFTSVQVNKNFGTGWEERHDHLGKDVSFQYCLSLGDFEDGELCWLEGDHSFCVSTKGVWQKMDGRHTHWVQPCTGDARYSLVLFCNNGKTEPVFYHSPQAQRGDARPVYWAKRTVAPPPLRPAEPGAVPPGAPLGGGLAPPAGFAAGPRARPAGPKRKRAVAAPAGPSAAHAGAGGAAPQLRRVRRTPAAAAAGRRKRAVAAPAAPSAAPAGAGAPAAERPSARPLQQLLKLKRKRARKLLESAPPPHSCGCQRRAWLRSVVRLSSPPVLRRCCGCQCGAGTDVATQRPLRVGHDFAGKNAPGEALHNLGVKFELVFTSEKDKHARKTIEANYSPHQMYNDITARDNSKAPACDLGLAGWPCIDNSMAGNRLGFRNPVARELFDCVVAYLREHKPCVEVLENVPGLRSVNGGRDWRTVLRALVDLGCYYVDWRVLNTAKHGVPQNRPRLYIVCIRDDCYRSGAFQWPEPIDDCPSVERFLDQRGPKPTLRTLQPPPQPGAAETWAAKMAKLWRERKEPLKRPWLWDAGASERRSNAMCDQCPCLLRSGGDIWISSHGRALSLRERCRLQGSNPDKINVPVSDHQWRMQLGNSMSINVLERLLSRLLPAAGLTSALPDRWASGAAQRELEETVRND